MDPRDYYKVSYSSRNECKGGVSREILDNETEFNANHFKLFDDFTTDLRISYNPLRNNYHGITRMDSRRCAGDPNDSGVDMENGNPLDGITISNDVDLLENEVMVDPWSSMDSSNSPLTDSGPSVSEECTPSTSSETPRRPLDASSPISDVRRVPTPKDTKKYVSPKTVKTRSRDLTLELETLEPDLGRRTHFLDDDFQSSSKLNIECRIPKPHFLDHSPSPDEFDERSDITNPNFLDDEVDGDDGQSQKKAGALPKRPQNPSTSAYSPHEDRPHRTNYRTTLHYGLESAARSSERDKRASQLYRGTWPGERDVWTGHDSASVRSFSSNGSADGTRPSSNLENKMECVCSLISLLSLSPENNADLSGPLLDMSRSVESCIAMRQAGCIPLLVQLIHSKVSRETRDRAAKALRNIIHTQTDDKAGRREARVWRLLEQVREYCYILEDLVGARKEGKVIIEDDATKHPSQSVAALMKLSFDEEHRHVVCQLGGLQALAALVSGDQAAHGSRTDDNTCLTMRKYAGMTLTNLTFGDGNNKSLLCSFKEFMMALVDQLESPNDDMRQVTAAVLRNLSWRADTNSKLVLREVGAVKGLTKAAMTCQKEATLKSVLSALWNLTAHCSMNKVALCSVDGALGFLVDMLSYNSPTKTLAIVENAGGIMRNVSSHIAVREDYRQILRERNCLSVLLQHLKSPSLTVVSNSCGTLWNLSARCPQDQQFLWEHGAVPMLRSLIHSKHKMIAMGSGAALKNLLNSKPGKTHIISLDTTARSMNLPALPTLGARKQKALEQELDQNLSETCDNIEPATSPTTSNREEKNLFTATERQIAMNLERHRMTSSSPLMGTLTSQISLSHSAHLASYLSCSNTLLKGALVSRSSTGGSAGNVNRSDSKDSVTSTHSDSVFERVMRTGKVPVPTPRSKDLMKNEKGGEAFKTAKQMSKDGGFLRYPLQAPIPPPRSTELRTNYTESGFDVDQDSCDQPVDYSRKYSETKTAEADVEKPKAETKKYGKKESATAYGDYQETDLDQPTDYSLRYAEHQSETGSDSEPVAPSVHEDTIKHFATEGTPYETPVVFSTATSMSDLRLIGKDGKPKTVAGVKENPEVMTHSDEKDTCSIEEPPKHDNDLAASTPQSAAGASEPAEQKRGLFDTKFSSGMISPEKPVNYCDEGTPGYFSRVSSLSSLGEPTEEDCLAKRNAMATINVEPGPAEQATGGTKDKEGCKAVTFAAEGLGSGAGSGAGTPGAPGARYVQETPLMFSRSSSLGSLPECDHQDDQGSVLSEISRLTSGWLSPSEIPDSPGAASPRAPSAAPRAALSPPDECARGGSVWSERVSRYQVEHTPAHLSTGTSLSSLTIEHEHALEEEWAARRDEPAPHDGHALHRSETVRPVGISTPTRQEPAKDAAEGADREECRVYCTEDTPAALSKAGSNSNLSALSIDSSPAHAAATPAPPPRRHESSDSSNLSDAADLLEECIQKGIDKVVKIKTAPAPRAASPVAPALAADPRHRSAPACARASTDTEIKRRAAYHRADRSEQESPAPPLPPRPAPAAAPPRPPLPAPAHPATRADAGRKHESGLPIDSERGSRERAARADSLSSLSADSFGSTDREIFEETVKAGLSSVNPRAAARHALDAPSSAERRARTHRSLDRSDKISHHRRRIKDPEFEINLAAGAYELKSCSEMNRLEESRCRPSHREETGAPGHQARSRSGRWRGDGPASLPLLPPLPAALGEEVPNRSDSLSSLSNDSFGSTDKEVFERCVRMGMPKPNKRKEEERGRGADRPEPREHRRRRGKGALDRMVGEDSKDRAILEEVIARGAGEHKPKNVPAPPAEAAAAGAPARTAPPATGSDATEPPEIFPRTNELPTVDSLNTTLESNDEAEMARSNECLAPASCANTTIESGKDELNRSNESYADVPDGSWSGAESPPRAPRPPGDAARKEDTWNDNTCPDDITFPTISGSVHLVSSIGSEGAEPLPALPDLLETSEAPPAACRRPDLTDKLDGELLSRRRSPPGPGALVPEGAREPSFASLLDEQKFDSILSEEIEREAARLAALLRRSHYETETGAAPLASLDLDDVKPPSNLGSLLSLSASVHRDEPSHAAKNSQRTRKRSLPVASMVKKALSNSMHRGSSERLDGEPFSFLEDVNPPSEMERLDMESSLVSVSSLRSEVGEEPPLVFDLSQPVRQFPLCDVFSHLYHDLDDVNPPSLFDEMMESTLELEPSKARQEDGSVTLRAVPEPGCERDSERGSPLPYDASSADSTPKRRRDPNYLTPKEKRHVSKDRYRTYTITDTVTEDDAVSEVHEEILAWREPDPGESGAAPRDRDTGRRVSARQRRLEDRARYQTQTVDVREIAARQPAAAGDSLERRLEHKKTVKQKRTEDADRFRTRTLSEDIPPSPTSVTKDANFENVETTTGYDSLSSEEPSHRLSDGPAPGGGGGRGEGAAHEHESSGVRTYTERYSRCLPVTESTAALDMCLLNNLKNIEMTASYRRADRAALAAGSRDPSSGDFGYEGDTNSEDKVRSESDAESPPPKPKIMKPARRHASLDSNDSLDREPDSAKAVRGRKKAAYVSPYRRSAPAPRRAPTAAPPPALSVCRPRPGGPPRGAAPDLARRTPGTPLPLERQGTFTKEESSVPPRDLPVPDKRSTTPRFTKSAPQTKTNTSPSRLPQLARHGRLAPGGAPGAAPGAGARTPDSRVRSSPSSHSLRSAAGAHTGTVTSRSPAAAGPLRRGAAGSGGAQPPRLLRSSTFEGRAAAAPRPAPTPRASQIPAPRARAAPRPPPHKARLPHKPARAPLTA